IAFSFGLQRELPGNFLLEATYFGRLGRRLTAPADAGQVVDFQDKFSSGHSLANDFFALTKLLHDPNTDPNNITPQPFFEDVFGAGATQQVVDDQSTVIFNGDLGDFAGFELASPGLGIGLHPQFGGNLYIAN